MLVSAVGTLRPQLHRVTIVTGVLNLEEASLSSVKSQVTLKTVPHLVLSRLKTAVVVHVAALVPGHVAENRLQAPVVAAEAFGIRHRPIQKAERHAMTPPGEWPQAYAYRLAGDEQRSACGTRCTRTRRSERP